MNKKIMLMYVLGLLITPSILYSTLCDEHLQKLIRQLSFIDNPYYTGYTYQEILDLATRLIAYGADVNYSDPETGESLLSQAAELRSPQMVFLLLEHGANPHLKNRSGSTHIAEAIFSLNQWRYGEQAQQAVESVTQIVSYLCGKGADINTPSSLGTALAIAKDINNPYVKPYTKSLIEFLVTNGAQ